MNKTDKILIIFYVILAVSFVTGVLHARSTFDFETLDLGLIKPIENIKHSKLVDLDKKSVFEVMTDVEHYPLIIPKNVLSVQILDRGNNTIIAKEKLVEKGIVVEIVANHTFVPYEKHTVKIIEGDAKGTVITQTFTTEKDKTWIDTTANIKLDGILSPFKYLPGKNIGHALDTVISGFVQYAEGPENLYQKTVDEIYREILRRPADVNGLKHYSVLLESGKLTPSELRQELLNSQEYSQMILPENIKSIDSLSQETKKIINNLYLNILNRQPDPEGMLRYGNLLESGKLTPSELRQELLNSQEYKQLILPENIKSIDELSHESKQTVNDLYMDVLNRPADPEGLLHYANLLESGILTADKIREQLLESEEEKLVN